MKLSHKTFILIFASVMILVGTAGCIFLSLHNAERLADAEASAYAEFERQLEAIDYFITEYRTERALPVLSESEIEEALSEFLLSTDAADWIVLPDKENIGDVLYQTDFIPERGTVSIRHRETDAVIHISSTVHFENGDNILNLIIPTQKINRSLYAAVCFAVTLLISILSAAVGTLSAARFEKKLSKMSLYAAKSVRSRDTRFPKYGEKELDKLALSLNARADSEADDMEKLQAIADGRKQFTDNLAHEMKTPLTSILGFSDILRIRRSVDDRTRMEYANIIFEEAKRMRGLSGKLLELATAGNTKLDFESVAIPAFFDEIRLSVLPLLAPRNISLKVRPAQISINADRELFKSLIYNLIENAAKASPDGSEIRLVCEATPETIKISVSDDGCGMSRDQIRRATEPFYMADKSRSRKAGGVGLGLALCAEIAEKHKARMVIQSKQGKGTTVTLIMLSLLARSKEVEG
ncbi:MAG: HAMP domain-containing histidine kinase [Clostridia bacterium]|nr:HAMP domain-containing histidine kinase [Clostridia bacterium]